MDTNFKDQGYKIPRDLNSWEKAYWYMRVLIDKDRFGGFAKKRLRMASLRDSLLDAYKRVSRQEEDVDTKVAILDSVLQQTLFEKTKPDTDSFATMLALYTRLKEFLLTPHDFYILGITVGELILPTNDAVDKVPSLEVTDFARKYAKAILDTKKEEGLATLVREWDTFTEDLALNKERDIIIGLFEATRTRMTRVVDSLGKPPSEKMMDVILSAVGQEYERRVGQKRKQRAGKDLESATEFIFSYFGFQTHGGPEHFSSSMEVDNWLKDKDGWYIGISLKRTLRERWKQTLTTEIGFYDRYKIKNIIHLINNDFDLSDNKIVEMGAYRHLFAMADGSSVFKRLESHVAMSKYVFPMSKLISKLNDLTSRS